MEQTEKRSAMLEKRKAVWKILTHRQKFLSAVSRRYPQWLPFMKPVAVVARSGGHIPRGADECSGRCSGRHKWRPYVFPSDGVLPIVGATFMSPGWQAELCGNAVDADGGSDVPIRFRAELCGNAVGAGGGLDVPTRRRASQVAPLRFFADKKVGRRLWENVAPQ